MMLVLRSVLAVAVSATAMLLCSGSASASNARDILRAIPAPQPLPADPTLKSTLWQSGVEIAGFTNVLTRAPATESTRARILVDSTHLYVSIVCEQSQPIHSLAGSQSAQFAQDDFAGVGVDTSGNGETVYYFGVTPAGAKYALTNTTTHYESNWTAVSTVVPNGWQTVLIIPFNAMLLRSDKIQTWRINVVRHIAHTDEDLTWAFDPLMRVTEDFSKHETASTGQQSISPFNAGTGLVNSATTVAAATTTDRQAWPKLSDARFWPQLVGVPVSSALARSIATVSVGGLATTGQYFRYFPSTATVTSRWVPQNDPWASYAARLTVLLATLNLAVQGNEEPLIPNIYTADPYQPRPALDTGGFAFLPARLPVVGAAQQTDNLISTYSLGSLTHAYKFYGTFGDQALDVTNAVGSGFNDTLFGLRHDAPSERFSWWVHGATTHHSGGYLGLNTFLGNDTSGEVGISGRMDNGFVYLASYASDAGTYQIFGTTVPTAPGAGQKQLVSVGLERPNYDVHVVYRDVGPQFMPQDGSVNLADVHGFAVQSSYSAAGSPRSGIRGYTIRAFGERDFDRSGAVHQTEADLSGALQTKTLTIGAGEYLLTRAAYAGALYPSPLVGFPTYLGRLYARLGSTSLLVGLTPGAPTSVQMAYSYGPNVVLTPAFSQGTQSTWTLLAQAPLPFGSVRVGYGANAQYYPQSLGPVGQTLRYVSVLRPISKEAAAVLAFQNVAGSPTGPSAPSSILSAFVTSHPRPGQELSFGYGALPPAPYFVYPSALAGWGYPPLSFPPLTSTPGTVSAVQLNRFFFNYQLTVNY